MCSIGNVSREIVEKYIQTQGLERHSSAQLKIARFPAGNFIKAEKMTTGLFYGGIGSRSTPPDILTLMTTIDLILVDR